MSQITTIGPVRLIGVWLHHTIANRLLLEVVIWLDYSKQGTILSQTFLLTS